MPLEINFSKNKFVISKCNPIGVQSSTDAECNNGSVPYTKVFRIAVEIVLDDGIGDQRGLTFFDAVIKDPCKTDVIGFTDLKINMSYTLRSSPTSMIYRPQIKQ